MKRKKIKKYYHNRYTEELIKDQKVYVDIVKAPNFVSPLNKNLIQNTPIVYQYALKNASFIYLRARND